MKFIENFFKNFYTQYNSVMEKVIGKIFPVWITPNSITIFRAFMFLPVIILLLLDYHWTSFIVFVISGYLDSIDGLLARHRKQETDFGAALDALMDKIFFICLLTPIVFLMNYEETDVLVVVLIFSSLVLIVPVEIWLAIVRWQDYLQISTDKTKKRLIKAGPAGKIKFSLETCGIGAFTLAYPNANIYFSLLGVFFIILSAPFAYRSLITKLNARSSTTL